MTVKKTAERTRETKHRDKASKIRNAELSRDEMPYTYESVWGVRYSNQVGAASLAKAPVLG